MAQKSIISGPSSVNSCRVVEVPSNKRILILGMIFSVVILSADRDVNKIKVIKLTFKIDFRFDSQTKLL